MTTEEIKEKREYNLRKYGLSQEEIDRVVIPVLTEKQTSEVFDKRTNQQLERQQLLSRLAMLRSALQVRQNGSDVSLLLVFLEKGFLEASPIILQEEKKVHI